jgi:peptide/nickel transport system ATP-binding protein
VSNVVDITDLTVRFATDAGSVAAVRGVSLSVAPREILAVVGESGSGRWSSRSRRPL